MLLRALRLFALLLLSGGASAQQCPANQPLFADEFNGTVAGGLLTITARKQRIG